MPMAPWTAWGRLGLKRKQGSRFGPSLTWMTLLVGGPFCYLDGVTFRAES